MATIVACALPLSLAAGRQVPRRDAPPVARAGTAIIAGVVVSDDGASTPIRRARVALESGLIEIPRGAVTDDQGRFVFAGLPAGNYTLTATKTAYVNVVYGAKRPGERPGLSIAVREGQRVDDIVMRMPRGAVITGMIRQPNGQPAPGIAIQAQAMRTVGGQRTMSLTSVSSMGSATTDDRGVYRLFGLMPGEYLIQSQPNASSGIAFFSGGMQTRRVTADEVRWAERSIAAGSGVVGAPAGPAPVPPELGQSVMFAPVYYPGTPIASAAAVVPVRAGEERTGIDFTMDYVPAARIGGTIVGPDGRPPTRVLYTLTSADEGGNLLTRLMSSISVRPLPDGGFLADGVAPGRYVLTARAAPGGAANDNSAELAALRMLFGGAGGGGRGSSSPYTLWAREELDINGRDVTNVSLRLAPGMTVSGRIAIEAASLPPLAASSVTVTLSQVQDTAGMPPELAAMAMFGLGPGGGGSIGTAGDDGIFEVKGVSPGRYRISTMAPGMMPIAIPGFPSTSQTWMARSILVGGRDVSDLIVEIRPNEDVKDVAITISDRVTELTGVVYDQAGRPTPAFPIVVFATDRAYWALGSRRVQQVRPASDGRYKFTALPAGEYYVCAPTDLDPNDLADPFFLEQLIAGSFKLTIAPGEKKTQDLRLQ
jgi:hypothetical protein